MSDANPPTPAATSAPSIGTSPVPPSQPSIARTGSVSDANPPTTNTVPTASAASTTTKIDAKSLNQKQSFIQYTPSAYNTFAYQPSVGKNLASLLVDDSGMASRFHLLSTDLFLSVIDGDTPTEDDYKKFKEPDLTSKKKEHELYPELAHVVQSVLDAAGCDVLRFLDTANHKAKDGNSSKKDTFNDGGIYVNSPLAREATDFTAEHRAKSQMSPEDLARRLLGLRSWHWIDILFELKMSEDLAAFYFKTKPRGRGYKKMFEALAAQSKSGTPLSGGATDPSSEGDLVRIADEEEGDDDDDDDIADGEGRLLEHDEAAMACDDPTVDDTDGHLPVGDDGVNGTDNKPRKITQEVPPFVKVYKDPSKNPLGQFVEYMLNVQKYQHRVFSYAVYICFDMARLCYFDRSGAFVSEPFEWTAKNSPLHQFVWKIAKLANAGRFEDLGHDRTATLASGQAKDKFLALQDDVSLPPHVREGFKKAVADRWPIYKVEVVSGEPSKDEWFEDITFPPPKDFCSPEPSIAPPSSVRYFLVGRPHFAADGLVGRCTRGYYAYDVTDPDETKWRVCFLKDSWRPAVAGRTRPEHLIYQRLRFCGVNRGIGTLICGGDVGGHWAQQTQVQKYLPEKNRPVLRVHYRLAIEEIGIRLEDFKSFPELSAIFVDVLQAHHRCWMRAHVLHRDISVGNIMILPSTGNSRRRGILIDWDLSRLECELGIGPVEPDRTGTWQFRSALSLRYPWKPYRCSDDIESFIHVYLYLILRYHVTEVVSLQELVKTLFEGASVRLGIKVGGDRKYALFRSPTPQFDVRFNPPLQALLNAIISGCFESYKMIDFNEMSRRYGFGLPSEAQPPVPEDPIDDMSEELEDFESDDEILRSKKGCELNLPPFPLPLPPADRRTDPCVVDGFLSGVGDLLDLFKHHVSVGKKIPFADKACDQFPARQHENVYRGLGNAPSLSAGTWSTTGTTFVSHHTPSNVGTGSMSSNPGSPQGSNFSAGPSKVVAKSSDSRKRTRTEGQVRRTTARSNGEPSDSVHRDKRVK